MHFPLQRADRRLTPVEEEDEGEVLEEEIMKNLHSVVDGESFLSKEMKLAAPQQQRRIEREKLNEVSWRAWAALDETIGGEGGEEPSSRREWKPL